MRRQFGCVAFLLAMGCVSVGHSQQSDAELVDAGFLSARPGFYLSIGGAGTDLWLDFDADLEPLPSFELERSGEGGALQIGWAFGRGFALELALVSTQHTTGRVDIDAQFTRMQLDAVAPLLRTGRVQPFVAGGLGIAGVLFRGNGIANTLVSGSQIDFGGGLDFHLMRRWALAFGYRYEILHFKQKTVESSDGQTRVDFGGTGAANLWTLRLTFSL